MKKVLLLVALIALAATPAMATIANSAHDLSSGNTNGSASNTNETCVFCHTPHGANANGPLWNRTNDTAPTGVYGDPSGTIDAVLGNAGILASDAALCLSCHDGTIGNSLDNPPNSLAAALAVTATVGVDATLGADMTNDHPVGFSYGQSITNGDTELVAAAGGLPLFNDGTIADSMWCSSCHEVHGNGLGTPFLQVSNVGSALCTTCHSK